ncbi:MAG: hypothetical protein M3O70_11015 [Actinomycetota bacterium]|nr:hypothetical protein [Actinomycetota bacterium]
MVGPYSELDRYVSRQGLGEDAHHIVGREHLGDVRTVFTDANAPSVALERQLHNRVVSGRITAEQRYLGGRRSKRSGRPKVTRREVADLYRQIYTFHTDFAELATIADNILGVKSLPPGSTRATGLRGKGAAASGTARSASGRPENAGESLRGTRRLPGQANDVSTRAGRLAGRVDKLRTFRVGFGADLVIQVATALMLGILESKLANVNEEGIRREYRSKVFEPKLAQLIDETVSQVRSGMFAPAAEQTKEGLSNKFIYLVYQYDVIMERQAETFSDAIISIIRGFTFVEIYYDLEPVGEVGVYARTRPLADVMRSERRKQIDDDLFRYRFKHYLLVWDPEAAAIFARLRGSRRKLLGHVEALVQKATASEPTADWAATYARELRPLIDGYRFRSAYELLVDGMQRRRRDLPKIPISDALQVIELGNALIKADNPIETASRWPADRQTVLTFYLQADPFGARQSAIRRSKAWVRRRRAAQRAMEERERETRSGKVESAVSSDIVDPSTERVLQRRFK